MEEREPKSKAFPWLLGCSIAIVATGLLCVVGGFFAFRWGMNRLADVVVTELETLIDESGLPEEQVATMRDDLGRLELAYREDRIDFSALETLEPEIERIASLAALQAYSMIRIERVELPAEEKEAARRVLQRCARGVQEDLLDVESLDRRVDLDFDDEDLENPDPERVRREIQVLKDMADAAEIPDEPYQADVATEFQRFVDGLIEN